MGEPKYESCGWMAPHEEHAHGIFHAFTCKGVPADTEYVVHVNGIMDWRGLRDEVAPHIRRTFPGLIVVVHDGVIISSIPDVPWRGASVTIIGLEYKTAESYVRAFAGEFGKWGDDEYPILRPVTDEEKSNLLAHRERIRK